MVEGLVNMYVVIIGVSLRAVFCVHIACIVCDWERCEHERRRGG